MNSNKKTINRSVVIFVRGNTAEELERNALTKAATFFPEEANLEIRTYKAKPGADVSRGGFFAEILVREVPENEQ